MGDAGVARGVDARGGLRLGGHARRGSNDDARHLPVAEQLPTFTYHPDAVATGAVARDDGACAECGRARGYLYHEVFGRDERICPWCIAGGRDLLARFPEARAPVEAALGEWEGLDLDDAFEPDVDVPSAYVFRCRVCRTIRAFSDYH